MRYQADFLSYPARMVKAKTRTFCGWCKVKEKVEGIWVNCDREVEAMYNDCSSHGICKECLAIYSMKAGKIQIGVAL